MTSRRKNQLLRRRERWCEELGRVPNLIRGSRVRGKKKCGRPGCKCQKKPCHPHVVISTHRDGKTNIVYVPKASEGNAQAAVKAYHRAGHIIDQLSNINIELLKAKEL